MLEHGEALRAAGITAKDADGAMLQLADVFSAMPDGIEKTNLATKIFGKSGMDLIPMLNMGSAGMADASAKSAKYAEVMGILAPQADKFNDTMAELSMASKVAGMAMVSDALPAMTRIAQAMADAAQEGGALKAILVGLGGVFVEYVDAVSHAAFAVDGVANEHRLTREIEDAQILIDRYTKLKEELEQAGYATDILQEKLKAANAEKASLEKEQGAISNTKNAAADQKERLENLKQFRAEMAAMRIDTMQAEVYAKAFMGASDAEIAKAQANLEKVRRLAAISAPEVKAVVSEYDKLIAKLKGGLVDATAAAQAAQHGYNKEQQDALKVMESPEWAKMSEKRRIETAAIMEATVAQGMQRDAAEKAKKAEEELQKQIASGVEEYNKYWLSVDATTASIIEKAKQQEFENSLIGKTKAEIEVLTRARENEAISGLEATLAVMLASTDARDDEIRAIALQIEALYRLDAARKNKAGLDAQADFTKQQQDDWKKFSGDIESSLTDALMNGFKNGENFGENFFSTLKAAAKTMVLKFGVELVTKPIMGGIQSVAQGGSFMQGASGLANIGSAFTTGGALTSSAGGYGAFAGSALGETLGLSEIAVIPGTGGMAAGSTLTGLGTAMPYIAAAVMAYSLLKGSFSGETRGGGTYGYTPDAGTQFVHGPSGGQVAGDQVTGSITNTTAMINGFLKDFGSTAVLTGFHAGLETSDKGRGGVMSGGTLSTGATFGESGTGSNYDGTYYEKTSTQSPDAQAVVANFTLDLKQATIEALQAATDLPKYISEQLKGVVAENLSDAEATNLLAYLGTLKQVRDALTETRSPLEIAQANIAELSGELHTSAETFKIDFVAAIDAGIKPETLAKWQALGVTIDQVTQAQADLARINQDWADKTLVASGAVTQQQIDKQHALASATSDTTKELINNYYAQIDLNEVNAAAAQHAQDIAAERKGLQDQLDGLTMTSAELLDKQRSALDESNRALFDQVHSLQAQKDATAAASSAMQAFTTDVTAMVGRIHESATNSIFNMEYGMLDNQGKYGMLDARGADLDAQMRGTTDIYKIADLAQKEIDLVNQAWGLLDAQQQAQTLTEYKQKLGEIDSFVTSSGASAIEIKKAQNKEMSEAVAAAVKAALAELALKMQGAADAQNNAAGTIAGVLREPVKVESHITVTAPEGSEVYVG